MGGNTIGHVLKADGSVETYIFPKRLAEELYAESLKSVGALDVFWKENANRIHRNESYARKTPEQMWPSIYYRVTFLEDGEGSIVGMSMPEEAVRLDGGVFKQVPAPVCVEARKRALRKKSAALAMKKQKRTNVRTMLNSILEQLGNGRDDHINTREVCKAVLKAAKIVKSM